MRVAEWRIDWQLRVGVKVFDWHCAGVEIHSCGGSVGEVSGLKGNLDGDCDTYSVLPRVQMRLLCF